MKPQLYELRWKLVTDVGDFYYQEFKVFGSDAEANRYGKERERELNNGLPIGEQADDGYYFKYHIAIEVEEVDSYQICLVEGVR